MGMDLDDTIAAISTPVGEGGIGIVRLSGNKAIDIVSRIFVPKDKRALERVPGYSLRYGWIIDPAGKDRPKEDAVVPERRRPLERADVIDEVLVSVMRAPKSYTREDIVEINCHGGVVALKKVLEMVQRCGARMAEPGEFTKRAFLNGRIDLAQAEAVCDIIRAKTESSLTMAMAQLEGALSKEVNTLLDELVDIASHLEAAIDFPDEDIEIIDEERLGERVREVHDALAKLLEKADRGIVMREGIAAILCGKPNVGKSSIMNALLRRERVIVTSVPGTTRDAVEELANVRGLPLRLVDTAGIGNATDILSTESKRAAQRYLALADIALFIVDGSSPMTEEDAAIIALLKEKKKKAIMVINKIDLPQKLDRSSLESAFSGERIVPVSALLGRGVDTLEEAILELVFRGGYAENESVLVSNQRHKESLEAALGSLAAGSQSLREKRPAEIVSLDVREAIYRLGLIVGRSVTDDVLNRIFENFCIGK